VGKNLKNAMEFPKKLTELPLGLAIGRCRNCHDFHNLTCTNT
jgi:hypothetical protein